MILVLKELHALHFLNGIGNISSAGQFFVSSVRQRHDISDFRLLFTVMSCAGDVDQF